MTRYKYGGVRVGDSRTSNRSSSWNGGLRSNDHA